MMFTAEQSSENWPSFDYKSQSADVLFTFTKAWLPESYFRFGSKIGQVKKVYLYFIFYTEEFKYLFLKLFNFFEVRFSKIGKPMAPSWIHHCIIGP